MDYRLLNKVTIANVMPLLIILIIHNKMRGKKLFSRFDIRWGYDNIQIAEGDQWKTGFKTTHRVFQSNVMNFGLCNAPATFSQMGVNVFKPLMDQYLEECDYYMDNFGIFTNDTQTGIERHRLITTEFLQICLDHSLFLCPEKCIFEQPEMDFLGFHICNGKILVDPSKISGIWDYTEQLNNITKVRKFLGIVGYHISKKKLVLFLLIPFLPPK